MQCFDVATHENPRHQTPVDSAAPERTVKDAARSHIKNTPIKPVFRLQRIAQGCRCSAASHISRSDRVHTLCGAAVKEPLVGFVYSSTSTLSRANAGSHCLETYSRYSRASSIGFNSSSKRLSRPTRKQRTAPTPSRTRRCLVTACRVRLVPAVRREIDCASPFASLARTDKRVSSPSAANTDARGLNEASPL